MPSGDQRCGAACGKEGKGHRFAKSKRAHILKPIPLPQAIESIKSVLPGIPEGELPQAWVSRFGCAYACGDSVLVGPPSIVPNHEADAITICPAAWMQEGVTTNWLKHKSAEARKAYLQERRARQAVPEPSVSPLGRFALVALHSPRNPGPS